MKRRVYLYVGLQFALAVWLAGGTAYSKDAGGLLAQDHTGSAITVLTDELSAALDRGNRVGVDRVIGLLSHQTSFALGMQASGQGKADLAERAFRQTLAHNPNNARARLELGRTLYEADKLDDSEAQFAKVMDEAEPPPTVTRNILRFMDRITQARNRSRGSVNLTLGILYDDNVNVGPEDTNIEINPFNFFGGVVDTLQVTESSEPRESWGVLTAATLFGEQDYGNRGDWSAIGSVSYYQTHLLDHQDFETIYASLAGGIRHTAKDSLLEIPVKVENYWRGNDDLLRVFGLVPTYVALTSKSSFWRTVLNVEHRDYADNNDQDSIYLEASEQVRHYPKGANGSYYSGGAGLFYEAADEDIFSNYGIAPNIRANIALAETVRLALEVYGRFEWYEDREALAPEDREDRQITTIARLEKLWNASVTSGIQYQFSKNDSTFDVYDFERNLVHVDTKLKF